MKNLSLFAVCLFILVLTGCTNIHFDNGDYDDLANNHKSEQWHHNFAAALYEGSNAVDLSDICPDSQWQSVHTYKSFTNGLAELVVNDVGPIWYPKTVKVSCAKVPYKVR